jgi:hypothetical protein
MHLIFAGLITLAFANRYLLCFDTKHSLVIPSFSVFLGYVDVPLRAVVAEARGGNKRVKRSYTLLSVAAPHPSVVAKVDKAAQGAWCECSLMYSLYVVRVTFIGGLLCLLSR